MAPWVAELKPRTTHEPKAHAAVIVSGNHQDDRRPKIQNGWGDGLVVRQHEQSFVIRGPHPTKLAHRDVSAGVERCIAHAATWSVPAPGSGSSPSILRKRRLSLQSAVRAGGQLNGRALDSSEAFFPVFRRRADLLSHDRVWAAIDALAERYSL
ncbi:hypothetical protein, partial [Mesorhizobium sp.]|uniref:hypothetical protein n=1 Tax=Mesorhizobium sp. TaxID=1871066 RepID=UPI0025CF2BA9